MDTQILSEQEFFDPAANISCTLAYLDYMTKKRAILDQFKSCEDISCQSKYFILAEQRYFKFMSMLAQHGYDEKQALVPPIDVQMFWHTHMLNPANYIEDCNRLFHRKIQHSLCVTEESYRESQTFTQKVWAEYTNNSEPFELSVTEICDPNSELCTKQFSYFGADTIRYNLNELVALRTAPTTSLPNPTSAWADTLSFELFKYDMAQCNFSNYKKENNYEMRGHSYLHLDCGEIENTPFWYGDMLVFSVAKMAKTDTWDEFISTLKSEVSAIPEPKLAKNKKRKVMRRFMKVIQLYRSNPS